MYKTLLATLTATALSTGAVAAAPAVRAEPLDAATLSAIKSKFGRLMELANNHDFKALHGMFWQSPSTLLVAKSAIQSEGNWAGFWGNEGHCHVVDLWLHQRSGGTFDQAAIPSPAAFLHTVIASVRSARYSQAERL